MDTDAALDPDAIDPLDLPVLERCAQARLLDRVLAAWLPRLGAGRASTPGQRARHALLRAVRLDLALLVRDPALLFECLYNRLFWYGSAEAGLFDGHPPSPEHLATSVLLRARLEHWRRDRRARGSAGRWARALRPPELSLDAPLLAEYREDLPQGHTLRLADQGSAIGLFQGPHTGDGAQAPAAPALAWDCRTGHRLDAQASSRAFVEPLTQRWELEQTDWGRCCVRDRQSGARVVDLRIGYDASFQTVAALPGDAGFLVAGWWDASYGLIARVDPPHTAWRWCIEVGGSIRALAVCAAGQIFAACDDRTVYLLETDTGQVLARVPLRVQGLALDPSGSLLATQQLDVLRVWDVAGLQASPIQTLQGCDAGFIEAQFSPDGQRLITGKLLCDAHDGHPVTQLELDSPGYIEGGPPEGGRLLANGRFVEMGPRLGLCVWETATGEPLVQDRQRRYSLADVIALAPDGQCYAHASPQENERSAGIALYRTDDGSLLAQLDMAEPGCIRFSRDNARVAVGSASGELALWSVPQGELLGRWTAHAAEVTDAVWSRTGDLLLTAGRDGMLRLWDPATASLKGERSADPDPWRATEDTVGHVDGWLGFSALAQPYTTRHSHGLVEIVDRASGTVYARVVTNRPLIASPDGTRWAHRWTHVAIESD